ncbi:MAG: ribosomal biogenesis protein [Thermoplasmata archaeon]|nr:MAG: ribosomal biogenesis protein [Thermoplasmata archaeon]
MMMFTTWFGTFLYEDDAVVKSKLFPKDAHEVAERMRVVADSEILEEERALADGQSKFLVLEERLTQLGGELTEGETPFLDPGGFGFSSDILHEAMMAVAREKSRAPAGADENIAQAVNALDDLTQTANLLSERLHDWYALHFPSHARMVKDEEFIELVLKTEKGELKEGAGEVALDISPISELARVLLSIHERRQGLEDYIKEEMEKSASNISHLVGPVIGARLIAKAGGLARLSKLPSGTIQMLGAEKAMFRHLREGAKPPKHGIIFQQPLIHRAPYWQRGKIARALASKIAIAAKVDEYRGSFIGEELKSNLLERIEEIKERYPSPKDKGRGKKRQPVG